MPHQPAEGALVEQRYELLKREADRGLGEPWQARDTKLKSRLVTVKFLREQPPDVAPPGHLSLALDEHLQAVRGLRHEGVLTILNHGVWGARPFVVHEVFDGRSLGTGLDDARRTNETLPVALLQALFEKLAATLCVAHTAPTPVLHLGIAPGNVLVRRAPGKPFQVKLLDFGVAPWASPDPMAPARSARAATFPAPEQLARSGAPITERTDVFALGCLLREMLALPPPPGQTLTPAGMDRRRLDVPDAVWEVIAVATQVHPAARYSSVAAMLDPLRAAWMVPVAPPPAVYAVQPLAAAPSPQLVAPPRFDAPLRPAFVATPMSPSEPSFVPFVLPPLPGVPSRRVDYAATLALAERAQAPTPWDAEVLSAMVDVGAHASIEGIGDFLRRKQAEARAPTTHPPDPDIPAGQTLAVDEAPWSADGATLTAGTLNVSARRAAPAPDGVTFAVHRAERAGAGIGPVAPSPQPQPQRVASFTPSQALPPPPKNTPKLWIGVAVVAALALCLALAVFVAR